MGSLSTNSCPSRTSTAVSWAARRWSLTSSTASSTSSPWSKLDTDPHRHNSHSCCPEYVRAAMNLRHGARYVGGDYGQAKNAQRRGDPRLKRITSRKDV